ncbi:hypothetical protein KKI90_01740 [Xenorhabdus bovienii]|uniref:hypothetical protein n=1 Tax=Xenorhabdus bovienii TaxID=40576 RepID=UPI00237CDFD1|nr:hypothetical protein [Xenorhabdus bovienii]MDE1485177.1 hypothetical protein [Xenorhabdus bovienii]MDE9447784.1 hypothetical protein [Xenorhabdus bovienii]MDE9477999.1 hypothetical protein [Xenorhabdus bovienii]MDE9528806.1 hypothetical protein [Xenorhabdus bovienii]
MTTSEQQKLAEILKLADECYGVNDYSLEKAHFTISQSVGTDVYHYVVKEFVFARGFESLRKLAGLTA